MAIEVFDDGGLVLVLTFDGWYPVVMCGDANGYTVTTEEH